MSDAICTVQGCTSALHGSTYCNRHYRVWKKHGGPLWVPPEPAPAPAPPPCIIEGCELPAFNKRGWCNRHYNRWRRNGDPLGGKASPGTKDPTCKVDGCGNPEMSLGWCSRHYTRWRTYGDPLLMRRPDPKESLAYFNANLMIRQPECKLWPYSKTAGGYGRLQINGERKIVSHLACEAFHGPCPNPDWEAGHGASTRCVDVSCWNGDHLAWMPHSQNMDMKIRDLTVLRGEQIAQAKLTEDDVREIRRRRDAGESRLALAEAFDVHVEHIGLIVTRKKVWLHVTD